MIGVKTSNIEYLDANDVITDRTITNLQGHFLKRIFSLLIIKQLKTKVLEVD